MVCEALKSLGTTDINFQKHLPVTFECWSRCKSLLRLHRWPSPCVDRTNNNDVDGSSGVAVVSVSVVREGSLSTETPVDSGPRCLPETKKQQKFYIRALKRRVLWSLSRNKQVALIIWGLYICKFVHSNFKIGQKWQCSRLKWTFYLQI